jgi:hypothetical protein
LLLFGKKVHGGLLLEEVENMRGIEKQLVEFSKNETIPMYCSLPFLCFYYPKSRHVYVLLIVQSRGKAKKIAAESHRTGHLCVYTPIMGVVDLERSRTVLALLISLLLCATAGFARRGIDLHVTDWWSLHVPYQFLDQIGVRTGRHVQGLGEACERAKYSEWRTVRIARNVKGQTGFQYA